ncbi:MAG TPA: biopolymer transporter ExbD [Candidatus Dormibacteraeota bacterium]|jgi:biopolymer transport protein ExbD|nr:biopolymer transporter ExbD [Candidatus Dormibacteraeota bacterium]
MSPLRLILAGLTTVLLAVAMMLWVGYEVRSEPYSEFYGPPEGYVFFLFFVESLCGAGILTILRGFRLALQKNLPMKRLPRIFPEIKLRNLTAWKGGRVSQSLVMASLNAFSVSWICVLMTLVTIFMIMQPRPSRGLPIDWRKASPISAAESPWPETMSVYIAPPEKFLVNGKATKREELEAKLREELGRRAEWTVYVEADSDTQFNDTIYAIDTIQGLGGKVVWITPKMRTKRCQLFHVWYDLNSPHSSQLVCDQSGWQ